MHYGRTKSASPWPWVTTSTTAWATAWATASTTVVCASEQKDFVVLSSDQRFKGSDAAVFDNQNDVEIMKVDVGWRAHTASALIETTRS